MLRDRNHKSILMRPLERLAGLPSPYGLVEGLGCIHRERRGPGRGGTPVPYLPKDGLVNDGVDEELTLGFAGDILDTKGLPAEPADDVVGFFADCDALIGNFESIITDLPGHGTSVRHDRRIVDALKRVFPPGSTYLSIANNHAGDYPADVLFESVDLLESRGFNVFGWNERPFVDVGGEVRVVGATDWSNAACDSVHMLEGALTPSLRKEGSLNILFPHWGYELELHPRRSMVRKAGDWVGMGFDAIIAHHGHTPRSIFALDGDGTRPRAPVADSLGDFICGFEREWYHYGIVMKLGVGRMPDGRKAVGRLRWEYCETRPRDGAVTTRLRADLPL